MSVIRPTKKYIYTKYSTGSHGNCLSVVVIKSFTTPINNPLYRYLQDNSSFNNSTLNFHSFSINGTILGRRRIKYAGSFFLFRKIGNTKQYSNKKHNIFATLGQRQQKGGIGGCYSPLPLMGDDNNMLFCCY